MGKQLSLFGVENRADKASGYDFDYAMLSRQEPPTNKAPRFVSLSILIHGAFVAGALSLTPLLVTQDKPVETITIELEESPAPLAAKGTPLMTEEASVTTPPPAQPAVAAAPAVVPLTQTESSPVVVKAAPVVTPKSAAKPMTKAATTQSTPAPVAKATRAQAQPAAKIAVAAQPSTVETFDSLDDIDAPELDNVPDVVSSPTAMRAAPVVQKVEASQARLDDIDESFDNSLDTQELDAANMLEQQALAQDQESLKQKNANAIAAVKQAEYESTQRAAAERLQAAKAAADVVPNGGEGSGHNGKATASSLNPVASGQGQGMRRLEQLKQMPNNPLPQYSADERFYGHQGTVVFQAYITQSGKPTQFRKVHSSGFENLDSKTLAALQNWKFYPGQEGWVELPFEWSLSGDAQETGRLRRASLDSAD